MAWQNWIRIKASRDHGHGGHEFVLVVPVNTKITKNIMEFRIYFHTRYHLRHLTLSWTTRCPDQSNQGLYAVHSQGNLRCQLQNKEFGRYFFSILTPMFAEMKKAGSSNHSFWKTVPCLGRKSLSILAKFQTGDVLLTTGIGQIILQIMLSVVAWDFKPSQQTSKFDAI